MRDRADNCVVVCSIENLDPMGVHTGDSITVAPAQTLSDVEYQRMRDAGFACIRRIGVDTGGSNIQFAVNPDDGELVVIEMNPRVSRSSALASKATGFPIAKIAARPRRRLHARRDPQRHHARDARQLRAHHRLRRHQGAPLGVREVPRQLRRARHPDAVGRRGHGHRAHVHRVAAEGPALARARPLGAQLRSRRGGPRRPRRRRAGAPGRHRHPRPPLPARGRAAPGHQRRAALLGHARRPLVPRPDRHDHRGAGVARRRRCRRHDPTRLAPGQAARLQRRPAGVALGAWTRTTCAPDGWSSASRATFKTVDTCGAEFDATTPYHYSTYEDEDEVRRSDRPQGRHPRLGAQPHRAGHRVRLLLRARRLRAARRGLRDGDDQLQPRDRLHRLRHERPPLLRAAHLRGRA